jgi:hypothetical protein
VHTDAIGRETTHEFPLRDGQPTAADMSLRNLRKINNY